MIAKVALLTHRGDRWKELSPEDKKKWEAQKLTREDNSSTDIWRTVKGWLGDLLHNKEWYQDHLAWLPI